jgi:carboxyl-terminal processing protease
MTESDPVPAQPASSDLPADQQPPVTPWPTSPPGALAPARPRTPPAAWVVSLALASVIGSLLFVSGYLVAGGSSATGCSAPNQAFAAFCDAYSKLKHDYVDPLDDSKLAQGAIQGMFQNGVADPFSGYMSPSDYQSALGELSGKFSGIGAEMSVKNLKDPTDLAACAKLSDSCVLVVVSPFAGSPAEKAGLKAGDIVSAVDGTSVNGSTISDEVTKVRGPSGTRVTLTITRGQSTFDVAITRAEITTLEVESRLIDGHVGYIALHTFSESVPQQFHDTLKQLLGQGATQIVFDLRDNPGGYIVAAQKIASEFIGSGIIFTQQSAGNAIKQWDAVEGGLVTDPKIQVAVLVNNGSASASEIVSAALEETGRATIIGEHTFGKITVQVWAPLEDGGGAVRITISRWFTPKHNSVHPDGVQPTIAVTIPAGTPPEKDLVLDRALAYLATQVGRTGASPAPPGSPAAALPVGALVSWDPRGQQSVFA